MNFGKRQKSVVSPASDQKGQATVEFALTMTILVAFVLFFIQLCLIFGLGNYVHYATFMSARALLSAGATAEDQTARAEAVIRKTLKRGDRDRFPAILRGMDGSSGVAGADIGQASDWNERLNNWRVGVRYTFKSRLFMMPLGRASSVDPRSSLNKLVLTSESWLSRDPSDAECRDEMNKDERNWFYDNGC